VLAVGPLHGDGGGKGRRRRRIDSAID